MENACTTMRCLAVALKLSSKVTDHSGKAQEDSDTMEANVAVEDFINTGRTGRRNAMGDISDPHLGTMSTAGVDFSFDQLSVSDSKTPSQDQSKTNTTNSEDKNQQAKS